MKVTRKELVEVLQAVQAHIGNADVLFDPNPQWEGEQARYDRACEALGRVNRVLEREG